MVLPHVAAFNLPAVPRARAALARALHDDDPVAALKSLARGLGAPLRLSELGVRESDLRAVIDEVLTGPYANPRPVGRAELEQLLAEAL
ncbi:hypothetical protein CFP75_42485 [Amycolatopsis alba DSM 44262]|uniref:Fe-containing alcohol dehydrogenase-like C-terminal domain-containing protein n=1 Tax=Amycolatopsis alba DSM 44262 TaxID=1125972 RepID=A0A229R753_AMYAL|nr:hypothetical protein CFP75_42485 [Amycolatopsis alba DSM 44262]